MLTQDINLETLAIVDLEFIDLARELEPEQVSFIKGWMRGTAAARGTKKNEASEYSQNSVN